MGKDLNPYAPPAIDAPAIREEVDDELATRTSRLAASMVDGLLLGAAQLGVYVLIFYGSSANQIVAWAESFPGLLLRIGTFWFLHLTLNGYLLVTKGQTIGKWIMNIKIVEYESGQLPTPSALFLKRLAALQLISLIPYLGTLFVLVDPLLIFGSERRCMHDLMAGTKVVNADYTPPDPTSDESVAFPPE